MEPSRRCGRRFNDGYGIRTASKFQSLTHRVDAVGVVLAPVVRLFPRKYPVNEPSGFNVTHRPVATTETGAVSGHGEGLTVLVTPCVAVFPVGSTAVTRNVLSPIVGVPGVTSGKNERHPEAMPPTAGTLGIHASQWA